MREVKFRAWDKKRKDMRDVKLMDWAEWWVSTDNTYGKSKPLEFGERNSFKNEETDRHILMQYTGLKDKNGKEIYEGDIIQCPKYYETPEYGYNPIELAGHVVFEEGAWRLSEGSYLHNEHESYGGDLEVIGNIYENPELIDPTESV